MTTENIYRHADTKWLRAQYKRLLKRAAKLESEDFWTLAEIVHRNAEPIARELDDRSETGTR